MAPHLERTEPERVVLGREWGARPWASYGLRAPHRFRPLSWGECHRQLCLPGATVPPALPGCSVTTWEPAERLCPACSWSRVPAGTAHRSAEGLCPRRLGPRDTELKNENSETAPCMRKSHCCSRVGRPPKITSESPGTCTCLCLTDGSQDTGRVFS